MTFRPVSRQIWSDCFVQILAGLFTMLVILPRPAAQAAGRAGPLPAADNVCAQQTQIPEEECTALIALHQSTEGDTWMHNDGWLTTATPCAWYGVICSNGHVTELDLSANNLTVPFLPHWALWPVCWGSTWTITN